MPEPLSTNLVQVVAGHLSAGDWEVLAIVGGGPKGDGLKTAAPLLKAFEIKPTDKTVVIICERD